MSITDELKGFIEVEAPYYEVATLRAIADRIDAEHAEAQRRWMAELDAARDMDGYIALPKDADGEHIHIGDMLEGVDHDSRGSVGEMRLLGDGWWVIANGIGRRPDRYRHHEPTVEDVMVEYATDWESA